MNCCNIYDYDILTLKVVKIKIALHIYDNHQMVVYGACMLKAVLKLHPGSTSWGLNLMGYQASPATAIGINAVKCTSSYDIYSKILQIVKCIVY